MLSYSGGKCFSLSTSKQTDRQSNLWQAIKLISQLYCVVIVSCANQQNVVHKTALQQYYETHLLTIVLNKTHRFAS